MAHDLIVICKGGKLAGKTSVDAEALDALEGTTFRAVLTEPSSRSMSALKLWWAICGMIADNYPGDLSAEQVSDVLKIESGHANVWRDARGSWRRTPRSIAFNKLSQEKFSALLDVAFGKASELFGIGLAEAARAELNRIAASDLTKVALAAQRKR